MRLAAALCVALLLVPLPVRAQDVACVQPVEAEPPSPTRRAHHRLARGEGVRVAVIDTGIAPHPHLEPVEPVADLVSPHSPDPLLDCDGHGTIVAGVIHDIAPGAHLLSIRQSSAHYRDTGTGTLDTLARGIHAALDAGAGVINISVVSCLDPTLLLDARPLHDALARAEADGAVVVAAAGNVGGQCRPGMQVHPAGEETVLSVAAVHPGDPHALADYVLSDGQVSAPGLVAVGPAPDGRGWASGTRRADGQETRFEGTSFAAPVISGVAALLRERHPHDSAAALRARIVQAAQPGHGVVDPYTTLSHLPADYAQAGRAVGVEKHTAPEDPTGPRALLILGAAVTAALLIGPVRAGWRRG